MCESHHIYHLCGHVKIRTTVQCAEIIEKLVASKSQVTCSHQLCPDIAHNSHVFPDICAKCQQTGVIGDVMEQQPGVKVELLQSWRRQRGSEGIAEPGNPGESLQGSEVETVREQKSLEATAAAERKSASTPDTGSEATSRTIETTTSSATSQGNTPELGSLRTRMAALKDRTEQLASKVRARKALQTVSKQNSRAV
ncbi:uncharacterized protein PV06_10763 [Exophiala oligosperma]|uniref:Uncharacterized protein n=1 Tax=Exophiala oligosperma TaxID=215243 RepID=A0A0D2A9U8_9EURO|nr:uncharacterized protein PV06_10763 [Exophiala oligosperma]KIW37141.1 hypothetical protein PV06_10763 [Exophiala oligosperma]